MTGFRKLALVAVALLASACGNDFIPPSVNTGVAVLTYRAPGVDFGSFATYAIVNKITVVNDTTGVPEYSYQSAPAILGAIEKNMAANGYVLVARVDPENPPQVPVDADLAMNVSVLVGTDYAFIPCDYWGFWGWPDYGCDAPWVWVPYRVGTLLMELGDLGGKQPGPPPVVPRVWAGAGYSVLTPENAKNTQIAIDAVNQAFAQSPYLVTP
ncbi:MAG: DUF4136 domain-containing protein [Anaeromyxobacteraceae bacterium]